MKSIFKIGLLLVTPLALACNNTSNAEVLSSKTTVTSQDNNISKLVGKWEIVDLKGSMIVGGAEQIEETKNSMLGNTLELKSDGTSIVYDKASNESVNGKFSVEGDVISIKNEGDEVLMSMTFKIEGSQLTTLSTAEDFYKQTAEAAGMSVDDLKAFVQITDLTFVYKKI